MYVNSQPMVNGKVVVKKDLIISVATKDRVEACKTYIESISFYTYV